MVLEQAAEAFARAAGVAGEHDLAAALAQVGDVLGDGLVDIGLLRPLRREIAGGLDAEVDRCAAIPGSGKGEARWMGRSATMRLPFVLARDRARRLERAVAAWLGFHRPNAVLEIILDRVAPISERLVGRGVANDDVVVAKMIEQGRKTLFEQRQPMLHARHAPAIGERLIERVLRRGRAELSRDSASGSA